MFLRITLASILAALSIPGLASATTVTATFDDLATDGNGLGTIQTPYEGLDLSCAGSTSGPCQVVNYPKYQSAVAVGGSGYQGGAVSGENTLSTGGAGSSSPNSITIGVAGGGAFSFDSVDLTGAWRDGLSIAAVGFNGTNAVDTTSFILGNAGTPTLFSPNWAGVTSVVLTASGGTNGPFPYSQTYQLAVDNLTYTAPASVPLPAAAWLLLSGLGVLGTSVYKSRSVS